MVAVEACKVVFLKLLVSLLCGQSVEREHYAVCLVAFVVYGAECGERSVDAGVSSTLVRLVYSHHHERHLSNVDVLPDEVFYVSSPQFLGVVATHHYHLAPLLEVDVVDKTSAQHLLLVYAYLVGINALHLCAYIVLAEVHGVSLLLYRGSHIINDVWILARRHVDVFVVQLYFPSFLQTVVGFGSHAASHHHGVVHETVALLHLRVNQSVTGTK